MTPSCVRGRRLAVALATVACLFGTALPAGAEDKDKKPPPPPSEPGPAPEVEAQQPAPAPAPPQPAPDDSGRSRARAAPQGNSGSGSRGEQDSKSKKRTTTQTGSGNSTGTSTPTAGGGSSGATTAAPQPAAPQPATPQPAAPAPTGGGESTDTPRRRSGERAGRERAGRRRADGRTPGAAPVPVIVATPGGGAAVTPLGTVGPAADSESPSGSGESGADNDFRAAGGDDLQPVTRTVERIVEVVPGPLKAAIAALGLVALLFAVNSFLAGARARRLSRQRSQLLDEVGLLQAALLPSVPARLGDLVSTVAYRPADGPAAGGDFYDAFAFDGGKVGVIVGDVSGHGREALARTALMRYTLRAYLDAGLEPRAALKVAGSALDDDLGTDFATVVLAVYDPEAGTLTYASAGHPPPILLGPPAHEPATSYSSPPVGVGATTGLRQTTVGLPQGSVACFFTDGMTDARIEGELLGRERLEQLLAELGPEATAPQLLDRVGQVAERTPDDMAACVLHAHGDGPGTLRVEELEVSRADLVGDSVPRFLRDCGIPMAQLPALLGEATDIARQTGTAVMRIRLGDWNPGVDVLPGNVETIAGAVQRRANIAKRS